MLRRQQYWQAVGGSAPELCWMRSTCLPRESYEWASYSARVGVSHCHWLDEPDTFRVLAGSHQMRIEAYRQFVEQENGSPSDELIRAAINSNKLTGGNKFVDEIENRIGIRVETRKPGRPTTEK